MHFTHSWLVSWGASRIGFAGVDGFGLVPAPGARELHVIAQVLRSARMKHLSYTVWHSWPDFRFELVVSKRKRSRNVIRLGLRG